MTLFTGLSAFPLTPVDMQGCLMPDMLVRHLDRLRAAGVDSIGLLGSTGSYAYLSHEERKRTVRVAADFLRGRTPLIVGVGSLRTDQAAELAKDAAAAGADGLLLAPMSYQPLTEEEVYLHFRTVAESGGLPLCIYNNPGTTKFTFSHNLIARLSQLPNVAAIKMPLPADGDFAGELAALRSTTSEGFSIGYSGDWGAREALLSGADCWFSVIAGLLPGPALALTRAACAGDGDRAAHIDQGFAKLWGLFRKHGSFRVMFVIANLLDQDTLMPLPPVMPLSGRAINEVQEALDQLCDA
ncbi:dihydrodipicolinate synthase family protein [Paracoccus methylarcula]|uniref:Dihydrodipicolinate synthase family protein n=1 Tax=Paracoccus methylarcula TaxID=72022 RepID=A0A422R239_9RHOB|nr:dihydrodipicolinate synthase family protein [Paracoccus methylarcula]RNF36260.1 dihydrodipicolinate synthase family protein [Paracoccus methylarcula]